MFRIKLFQILKCECFILICWCMQNHNKFFRKIYLSLYRIVCERELESEQNSNILSPTVMAITAFLSRSPGLLNRGPGGPASLEHGPHSSIFSPTGLISNCLTSCLHPGYIIVRRPPSCERHKSRSIQPVHGQGYILIFLDWMHVLFTQVHFLFWQLGGGQYVT